jgi:Ca2+:H+ antiporter
VKILRWFLVFVPLAIAAEWIFHSPTFAFVFSCLGLLPVAGLLGEATEELSHHTGERVGGLLNATLGNAAELIISVVALRAGKVELVKASIIGSILGNLLLILGLSLLVGGLKNGLQRFDPRVAGTASTMMFLSVIGMLIPTIFEVVHKTQRGLPLLSESPDPLLDRLSLGVAGVLILVYLLSLLFSLTTPSRGIAPEVGVTHDEAATAAGRWSIGKSVGVLAAATLATVVLSELLVGTVEPVVRRTGVSEVFLGIVLIPLIGNVAEHLVAVSAAWRNRMELSLAISLGSSQQIALFVAPLLVFVSLLFGNEMTLFFHPFEVVVLALSVLIAGQVAADGESNWLEGAQLLVVFTIVAMAFLWL